MPTRGYRLPVEARASESTRLVIQHPRSVAHYVIRGRRCIPVRYLNGDTVSGESDLAVGERDHMFPVDEAVGTGG